MHRLCTANQDASTEQRASFFCQAFTADFTVYRSLGMMVQGAWCVVHVTWCKVLGLWQSMTAGRIPRACRSPVNHPPGAGQNAACKAAARMVGAQAGRISSLGSA